MKTQISLIVPTRNEEAILTKNLTILYNYVKKLNFDKFEILHPDYSKDSTPSLIKNFSKKHKEVKLITVNKKGIGAGVRAGILSAKYSIMIFYPMDLSFDISCIKRSVDALIKENQDLVLSSRGLKGSKTKRPLPRRIMSFIYIQLANLLFHLHVKDSQGVMAFKNSTIRPYINKIISDDGFFQTEFVYYARKYNQKIKEIPVDVIDLRKESVSNPIKEGISMFTNLIKKYIAIKKQS